MDSGTIMKSYCEHARSLPVGNHHRDHHDLEHGTVAIDDDDLFRRLILEINQAGLSFDIVLKKKKTLYEAFPDVKTVSKFTSADVERLMGNPGIIRNRLKINAAIFNANKIVEIQKTHGSFGKWLDEHRSLSKEEWIKLFKNNFKFTGGEILNELLMSTCYRPGAHTAGCKFFRKKLHG
jgi:DNA-3-methyladenine glycosylase I